MNTTTGAAVGPALTFLCPAYRTEAKISQTIASVRAQTSDDWELVIVDNGPSDEMARIVEPYTQDPRIRLVRMTNDGMQPGVNAAAAAARGRYFAVLNSDDLVLPEFCARMVAELDGRPGVAAVTCDAHLFRDSDGTRLPRTYLQMAGASRPDGRSTLTLTQLVEGVCPYYTAAIRREAWQEAGGYVARHPAIADLDLWLRMVSSGHSIVSLPEPLGLYRQCEESMSRDLRVLDRALRRSRHRRAVVSSRIALFEGDLPAARRLAATALRERVTARAAAILFGLTIAPRAVARLYSAKRAVASRLLGLTGVPDPIIRAVRPR
jgi:glycosyltransferase involved in cell wall biosynthesis